MGPGGGGNANNPVMILLAPSVQKELKLTDDQKTKIYSMARTASQKGREMMRSMASSGGGVNPQMMMQAGMQIRQETEQSIAKILDTKQKERLDQIVLRVEGPIAVARPEIAEKLRLNSTQNEKIQGIVMEMRQGLSMAIGQGTATGRINRKQASTLTAQYRKAAVQQIAKVLESRQEAAFNKMLGEPFDVTKLESETSGASLNTPAAAAADPASSKPGDSHVAKVAPAEGTAKKTKEAPRKKGRPRTGSNP